jgi:hypothetical protein
VPVVSAVIFHGIQVVLSVHNMPRMDRDLADLRCFAALLDAHRQWETETGLPANIKSLREWLWFHWQAPRRPQPLVRSKYPALIPRSMAARQIFSNNVPGGLVMEHGSRSTW